MRPIDDTHSPDLKSWVESANDDGVDFPIQNLPFCRFTEGDEYSSRIGVGIGDQVLDLGTCAASGLLSELPNAVQDAACESTLSGIMQLSVEDRIALRRRISELLSAGNKEVPSGLGDSALLAQDEVELLLPVAIRDYTDFYASVFHATNVGSMFRPDNPLLPNYKHIPIGYHGRASSIVASGTSFHRPVGQLSPAAEGEGPTREPCKLLDYELEVGAFVGPANEFGKPITLDDAEDHLFGLVLVNDWSARDMQKWEYQPLGPFLAKSFCTTISPWVITLEALAPFRCATFLRPAGDPQPLDYLRTDDNEGQGGFDLRLSVGLLSEKMRHEGMEPMTLSCGNFRDMYWTLSQMLTHHSSNGCNMQTGDLLASGTVSNQDKGSRGCLLELTWDGDLDNPVPGTQRTPITLPTGEERKFLADGDEVVMRGWCESDSHRRIGFGECRGTVLPALS